MRYTGSEAIIAPCILPSGGTVTVKVFEQISNTIIPISDDSAQEITLLDTDNSGNRPWQWSLSNITSPINGLAHLIIQFKHSSGKTNHCKITVKGSMDKLDTTLSLVMATL